MCPGSDDSNVTVTAHSIPWPVKPDPYPYSGVVLPAPESAYDLLSKADVTFENIKPREDDTATPASGVAFTPRSPGSLITSATGQTLLRKNTAAARDVEAVNELLETMKLTLSALGATFDTLGNQTMAVAALGPAIDANNQISLVRRQLYEQHQRQEQRMQDVKALLQNELKSKLRDRLKETADEIIRDAVRREIAARVRRELYEQISQSVREEAVQYKIQMLEVKTSLHNSEARRHNALIRSNSLDEPLRPLLRPQRFSATPVSSAHPLTAVPSIATPAFIFPRSGLMSVPQTTSAPALSRLVTSGLIPEAGVRSTPMTLTELELAPPTASPLFPRDVTSLIRLRPQEVKTLLGDYGLQRASNPPRASAGPSGRNQPTEDAEDEDGEGSREENLNRFMSYIGVGFQLVPTSLPPRDQQQPETPSAARNAVAPQA